MYLDTVVCCNYVSQEDEGIPTPHSVPFVSHFFSCLKSLHCKSWSKDSRLSRDSIYSQLCLVQMVCSPNQDQCSETVSLVHICSHSSCSPRCRGFFQDMESLLEHSPCNLVSPYFHMKQEASLWLDTFLLPKHNRRCIGIPLKMLPTLLACTQSTLSPLNDILRIGI